MVFLNIYCIVNGFLLYMVAMMTEGLYSKAHCFIAAIRVLEHLHRRPPSLKEISDLLRISQDETSRISRRLENLGVIRCIKSGVEERFIIHDHLKIESIPKEEPPPAMLNEVMRLKQEKENKMQEFESLLKKGPAKPDLFNELDKALKDPSKMKKKPNPLD
jgi:DNA-binding Lrp family transcriptional regulator